MAPACGLECAKAKDAAPFQPWNLHLAQVGDSCVIRLGSNPDGLSTHERQILETLPAAFGSDPAPSGKLLVASDVPERSYYRAVQSLEERGLVSAERKGRTKLYSITPEGEAELLPTTADDCHGSDHTTTANATTLRGGGWQSVDGDGG